MKMVIAKTLSKVIPMTYCPFSLFQSTVKPKSFQVAMIIQLKSGITILVIAKTLSKVIHLTYIPFRESFFQTVKPKSFQVAVIKQ